MRRLLVILALTLLLPSSAQADLDALLQWQQVGDSGAFVSSGFHDWRTVSKYRRNPGLHAGYDVAMLAGSAVRTPWAGQVVAITPWYGTEVGVTLLLQNGYEVTFGHITADVWVGQKLPQGATLGKVVVDHVDVKMRNAQGHYVDFGKHRLPSGKVAPVSVPAPDLSSDFALYQEQLSEFTKLDYQAKQGLVATQTVEAARQRLEELRPLAERHAQRKGLKLPQPAGPPPPDQAAGRPVADWLLSR